MTNYRFVIGRRVVKRMTFLGGPEPQDYEITVLRDTVSGQEIEDPTPLQAAVFIGNGLADLLTKGEGS